MWVSLAFLAGVLLASRLQSAAWPWLVFSVLALALAIAARLFLPRLKMPRLEPHAPVIFLAALSLASLLLGAARYRLSIPRLDAGYIAWYNDRQYDVLVTGALVEPPDVRDTYANLRISVSAIDPDEGDLPVKGLILARVRTGADLRYGDVVRVRGHLKTPPEGEDFSYRDYLARHGIHAYMADATVTRLPFRDGNFFLRWVYTFKAHTLANLYRIFPDPEASLLAGILLGEDNGLPADLQQAFKNTGTAHIIAISGFNITIIAALFVTLFSRLLGTRRGMLVAVGGIFVYTILVGADAAVVRAAIMGTLGLFARQVGRRQSALNTLLFTGAVMTLINPHTPWDVGFQLSFFATLGLILYAGPFQEWATGLVSRRLPLETARKIAKPLAEYVFFTLAAQLTTLPIMAWHFGRISLVSLVANPFILPAQPPVMILGGLAALLSLIALPLGQVAAWIAWPFPAYTIRIVELFDRLPHGVIVLGDFSFVLVVLFYALLFSWTFSRGRLKQALRASATPAVLLVTLATLSFTIWRAALSAPDGLLHLTFLDVGSAEAVLIRTPSGHTLLVNGGESPSRLASGLGRRLSPLGQTLDWLVVASPQEAQVAALPRLIERFPPGSVLWAGNVEASYSARSLHARLTGLSIPVTFAYPRAALDLGQGARLEVLTVSPRGALLLVEWEGFRALLPLGMNFDAFESLGYGKKVGAVTVLLLADSGYAASNPPAWIENLRPQVVVLSVAADDKFGLPARSVLESVDDLTLLRTDRDGWIEVTTDGSQLWLETARGRP